MDKSDLEVGQRVWVYGINDRGKEPEEHRVVKIGRTRVSLVPERWIGTRNEDSATLFHIDSQQIIGNDYGYHFWFRTDEQRADEERADAAIRDMRSKGVELGHRKKLTADQIVRIAAIVNESVENGNS